MEAIKELSKKVSDAGHEIKEKALEVKPPGTIRSGVSSAGRLAVSKIKKMALSTKGAAGTAFIRMPVRVVVKACMLLCQRLFKKNYTGSVKGTIGLNQLRFGWNSKISESDLQLQNLIDKAEEEAAAEGGSEEEKKHEGRLNKLVGMVVDRLLAVMKIMAIQMQEMRVKGALAVKVRVGYLGPPSPGTGGLPSPVKFSLGLKVNTESVPDSDVPELDDNEHDVIVLPEQEDALGGDLLDDDQTSRGSLRVTIIEAKGLIGVRKVKKEKKEEKEEEEEKEKKLPEEEGEPLLPESEEKKKKKKKVKKVKKEKVRVSSPWVEIESGQHYQHTEFVKDNLTPVWNETFSFPLNDDGSPPPFVHFAVRDFPGPPPTGVLARIYSKLSHSQTNKMLGNARISTLSLTPKTENDLWVGLTEEADDADSVLGQGGPKGDLHLKMLFDPRTRSPPVPPPRESALQTLKEHTARTSAEVKEKGALTTLVRKATRMQVRAAVALRKRCRERGFVGSISTYGKYGAAVTGFELDTEDSEKNVEKKASDALVDIIQGDDDNDNEKESTGRFQRAVDKVVNFLLDGITIGAHEMHKKNVKGSVWFGQYLPLGLSADIMVGLYIDCDSVPTKDKLQVEDIDLEERLSDTIDELEAEAGEDYAKPEKKIKGVLKVEVVEAKELQPLNGSATCDPYACVKVGDDLLNTKVIQESLAPRWKQELLFPAATVPEFIDVKLYDDTIIYSDVKLGQVRIPTGHLSPGMSIDQWLPLDPNKRGFVRVVLTYQPEPEVSPIAYTSAWDRLKTNTGHKTKKTGRRVGKGTIRTGFKLAILSAIISRNRIKERGYRGKGMTSVKAVLWQMAVTITNKDSSAVDQHLQQEGHTKGHSRPIKMINACLDKLLDAVETGCEEVHKLETHGTLKVKAAAMVGLPVIDFFGITTGMAVNSDSVIEANQAARLSYAVDPESPLDSFAPPPPEGFMSAKKYEEDLAPPPLPPKNKHKDE